MYEYRPEPASSLRAVLFVAGAGLIVGTAIVLPGPDRGRDRPRSSGTQQKAPQAPPLDPAAWGSDHVGGHVPEYLTGDECLFCHRLDIGPGFAGNRHNLTIRPIDEGPEALKALKQTPATRELADAVVYLMGGPRRQRFLKPAQAYGTLDLLSTQWEPRRSDRPGKLIDVEQPRWSGKTFGDACAGCHATGVEAGTRAFSAVSLDCYVCHGAVDPKHSKDITLVHLSRARRDPPRVLTSICAQCHVRTGRSKSTNLPYPNTFVAGDNLFRDFTVDLSAAATARLDAGDRHVQENIRDVVVRGDEAVTCLSCHDVHRQSSAKHHRVARRTLCLNCHDASGQTTTYDTDGQHSATCGY
jgi:predicted CXXCH cytochrome family protein